MALPPAPLFKTANTKHARLPTGTYRTDYEVNQLKLGVYYLSSELEVSHPPQKKIPGAHCHEPRSEIELFFDRVGRGEYKEVKKILMDKPELGRYKGIAGDSALHVAAARGLSKMTKLLAQVSDIDGRNQAGWTPLHLAILNGHANSAQALAEKGASFTKKDHGALTGKRATPEDLVASHTSWKPDQLKLWKHPPKRELPPPGSPRRPECRKRVPPEPAPPPTTDPLTGEIEYAEAPPCPDDLFWKAIFSADSPTVLDMLVDMFDPNVYDDNADYVEVDDVALPAYQEVDEIDEEDLKEKEEARMLKIREEALKREAEAKGTSKKKKSAKDDSSVATSSSLLNKDEEAAAQAAAQAARPKTGTPLIVSVCAMGNVRMAELMLQFGAMPDAPDRRGVTPLIAAAANGHHAVVFKLVEKLKDLVLPAQLPRVLDCTYKTPLRTDLTGRSALLAAASRLEPRCVQVLLESGCNPKAVDACGQSALHLACAAAAAAGRIARRRAAHAQVADAEANAKWEKEEAAKKVAKPKFGLSLGGAGASPKSRGGGDGRMNSSSPLRGGGGSRGSLGSRGSGNSSPLSSRGGGSRGSSSRGGSGRLSSFDAEPPPGPPVTQARIEADKARGKFLAGEKAAVEIVRAFVSKQYLDVNERNGFGATPLHLAARDGVAELVTFMLENGAEIDPLDEHLRTPLHLACANAHLAAATSLVNHGANLKAVSGTLTTPIALAAKAATLDSAPQWFDMLQGAVNQRREAAHAAKVAAREEKALALAARLEAKTANSSRVNTPKGGERGEVSRPVSPSQLQSPDSPSNNPRLTMLPSLSPNPRTPPSNMR